MAKFVQSQYIYKSKNAIYRWVKRQIDMYEMWSFNFTYLKLDTKWLNIKYFVNSKLYLIKKKLHMWLVPLIYCCESFEVPKKLRTAQSGMRRKWSPRISVYDPTPPFGLATNCGLCFMWVSFCTVQYLWISGDEHSILRFTSSIFSVLKKYASYIKFIQFSFV